MDRLRGVAFLFLEVATEILHMQRPREIGLQRVEEVAPCLELEDRAEDVEVPVGVQLERAVFLRAAWRRLGEEVTGIRCHVIHAGARAKQILNRGLKLAWKQAADVVDAELRECLGRVDVAARDLNAVQHRQNAFSD